MNIAKVDYGECATAKLSPSKFLFHFELPDRHKSTVIVSIITPFLPYP